MSLSPRVFELFLTIDLCYNKNNIHSLQSGGKSEK